MDHVCNELITRLIETIYQYKHTPVRVMYDTFSETLHKEMESFQDAYTENEIKYIQARVEAYKFKSLIVHIYEQEMLQNDKILLD
jgi:hypothetical protein